MNLCGRQGNGLLDWSGIFSSVGKKEVNKGHNLRVAPRCQGWASEGPVSRLNSAGNWGILKKRIGVTMHGSGSEPLGLLVGDAGMDQFWVLLYQEGVVT